MQARSTANCNRDGSPMTSCHVPVPRWDRGEIAGEGKEARWTTEGSGICPPPNPACTDVTPCDMCRAWRGGRSLRVAMGWRSRPTPVADAASG